MADKIDTQEFEIPETVFIRDIENEVFDEAVAAKLAALLKSKNDIILDLIKRTEELGAKLQNQSLQHVLCYADKMRGIS